MMVKAMLLNAAWHTIYDPFFASHIMVTVCIAGCYEFNLVEQARRVGTWGRLVARRQLRRLVSWAYPNGGV